MTINTEAAQARMADALFIPARSRSDCCGRCSNSRVVQYQTMLRCDKVKANVAALSVCAEWRPIQRWIKA